MFGRLTAVVSAIALIASACAPEPGYWLQQQRPAITNGTVHTGHPEVGRLVFSKSGGTTQDGACTATLVGAKTVVTAAHCAGYPNTDFILPALGFKYKVTKTVRHTSWKSSSPYHYDIGLVLLNTAPQTAPAKLALDPPVVGQAVKMIGYGETSAGAGDDKIKRIATNTVAGVQPLYFTIAGASGSNGNACFGDSGGPVIVTPGGKEAITGIMSYITGSCGVMSYHTRVDLYTTWLKQESAGDVLFLDQKKPVVGITSPANGATVGLSVALKVTATDNVGVTSVKAFVDGAQKSELKAPPYNFTLALAPGKRVITAVAADAAGNQGSAAITVTAKSPAADLGVPDQGIPDSSKPGADLSTPAADVGPPPETGTFDSASSFDQGLSVPDAGFTQDGIAGQLDAGDPEPSGSGDDGCSIAPAGARDPHLQVPVALLLLVLVVLALRSRQR